MKIALISFTKSGAYIGSKIKNSLYREMNYNCNLFMAEKYIDFYSEISGIIPIKSTLHEWTKERFADSDAIIFISATGIAVRAVAPCIKDKTVDPAVIVVDDCAKYAISLLSGHIGGANKLAYTVSKAIGAQPVITTATDNNKVFSVDLFAKKNDMYISDMEQAKLVTADLLDKNPVGFYSDFKINGNMPEGFTQKQLCEHNICITIKQKADESSLQRLFIGDDSNVLFLIPRIITLGIGCKKNITFSQIEEAVKNTLKRYNIRFESIAEIASADIKKEEIGLCEFAEKYRLKFNTYTADELESVEGSFSESEFVRRVTGTGNVCERASLYTGGDLLIKKQVCDGVTIAAAIKNPELYYQ